MRSRHWKVRAHDSSIIDHSNVLSERVSNYTSPYVLYFGGNT